MRKYSLLPAFILISFLVTAQVYLPFKEISNYTDTRKANKFDSSQKYLTNRLGFELHYLYPLYQAIGWEDKFKKLASENSSFFSSMFFQKQIDFNSKIGYSNGEYFARDESDQEAIDFIGYLGLNDPSLSNKRSKYISRLKLLFDSLNQEQKLNYLREHIFDLKFPTAIESEFNLDLSEIISFKI